MRSRLFFIIIGIQLILAVFLCYQIERRKNKVQNVFTINSKYYQYPLINGLRYFYELKGGIGRVTDLTNVPSWLERKPTYYINSDGLNETINNSIEKPEGTFRVITLGDSFTFGLFLNTVDSWPHKLQKLFDSNNCSKKVEVINLGLGGYDARYEGERFVQKGLKYNPDLVLWLVKDEDFLWMNEYLNPLLLTYERRMVSKEERDNTESLQWKNVLEHAQNDYQKQVTFSDIGKNANFSLSRVSTAYGGQVVLLNLPEYSDDKRILKILKNFVLLHKGWALDSYLPPIIQLGGTFPESHPNKKGSEMIAASIFSYLKKNKFVNCFSD